MILQSLAKQLGSLLKINHQLLAVAESCTGGEIAAAITSIPGSSAWFDRGFVTYTNQAKQEMLGVPVTTLDSFGAVSSETACQMAEGALAHSHATVSLAVTGIAGPDGGTAEKPVGTVWFAWVGKKWPLQVALKNFSGDRVAIREQSVQFALQHLIEILSNQ